MKRALLGYSTGVYEGEVDDGGYIYPFTVEATTDSKALTLAKQHAKRFYPGAKVSKLHEVMHRPLEIPKGKKRDSSQ